MKDKSLKGVISLPYYHANGDDSVLKRHQTKPGSFIILGTHQENKIVIAVKLFNNDIFKITLTYHNKLLSSFYRAEEVDNSKFFSKFKILDLDQSSPSLDYFITRIGGIEGVSMANSSLTIPKLNDDRRYIALAVSSLEFNQEQKPLILSKFPTTDWYPTIYKTIKENRVAYVIDVESFMHFSKLSLFSPYSEPPTLFINAKGLLEIFEESKKTYSFNPSLKEEDEKLSTEKAAYEILSNIIYLGDEFLKKIIARHNFSIREASIKREAMAMRHFGTAKENISSHIFFHPYFHANLEDSEQAKNLLLSKPQLYIPGSFLFYARNGLIIFVLKLINFSAPTFFELFISKNEDGSLQATPENNPLFRKYLPYLELDKKVENLNEYSDKFGGFVGVRPDGAVAITGDYKISPIRLVISSINLNLETGNSLVISPVDKKPVMVIEKLATSDAEGGKNYTLHNATDEEKVVFYRSNKGFEQSILYRANDFLLKHLSNQFLVPQQRQQITPLSPNLSMSQPTMFNNRRSYFPMPSVNNTPKKQPDLSYLDLDTVGRVFGTRPRSSQRQLPETGQDENSIDELSKLLS